MFYRFAHCTLDTVRHTLHHAGQDIRLSRKVFEVLCYLITERDRVVSKQELCDHIWQGAAISDAALESCIRAVRASVGDTGQAQRIIQTQRGYGYQFVATVEVVADESTAPGEVSEERENTPKGSPVLPLPRVPAPPSPEPVRDDPSLSLSGMYLCLTCQHPNQGNAIFCAACGTKLRQNCPACGQHSPIPAAFCTACGQPFVSPVLSGSPSLSAVLGSNSGERKPITVLCCEVSLVTHSGVRVDMDTQHNMMQGLYDLAQDVMRLYGGRLHSAIDEHLLIMFGVPVVQEDDAQRAVRVALELRQRLHAQQEHRDLPDGTTLTLRSGLHTGLVVIGGKRDDTAAVATVVGDVMSCAMALQEQALPGSILCSDATMRLIQGTVHLGEGRVLPVSGQPLPVMAYTVLAENTRRPPGRLYGRRTLSPFVGRGREIAALHDLLAQAEAGRGQVVGIVGEAGIGKSRLAYEFRQSLNDHWLTYRACRCLSYGNTTPYLPVLELVRDNCGITEIDRPEEIRAKVEKSLPDVQMEAATWVSVLLHLLGVPERAQALAPLSPEARKVRTMTALTQLCLHGCRQRPLILEVEDLHWIDASSDECLSALIERIAGVPLLLLATYRPGYRPVWIDKSYATQISLHRLAPQESLQVVQTILPTETLPTPLVPQLLAKADGNPFFLEELAQTVAEQGGDVPVATVPDTVQAVLIARIDRLPTPAKSVLQAAAVIGKDIDLPLLQAIVDIPDEALQHHLTSLRAAEFLYEAHPTSVPVYTFKHVLTQEVTYQSLLRRIRQQYHTRIAQVLEGQFPEVVEKQPELLAHHYTGAEQAARAIPYWQRAGQRAVERSANVEAISHFTTGLELLQTLSDTSERVQQELALQLAIGSPLMMIKGHTSPEVERTYARAYELTGQLGESPQHFSVLAGLWRFYLSRSRLLTARELGEQCFAIAERMHNPGLLHEAHLMLGSTLLSLGEPISAREHLEQGIALYDPASFRSLVFSRSTDSQVVGLSRLAWTLWTLGYPDQALLRSHEALTLARELAHPYSIAFALHFAGLVHQYRREVQLAQARADETIALAREHNFVLWVGGGMLIRGWALVEQGKAMEEGIAQIRQGGTLWLDIGNELGRTHILAALSEAYAKLGHIKEGLAILTEAFDAAHKNAERHYEAGLHRLKGEFCLRQKQAMGAQSLCSMAGVSIDSQGPQEVPLHIEAERCFCHAIHIARDQCAKSLELQAVMSLARLWQHQDRRAEARQLLAQSYGWFTEGFDTPDLQEARALLNSL